MKHTDLKAIYNFLFNEGYTTISDPTYFIKNKIGIDVFDDGLTQIWRRDTDEQIGEIKVKSYAMFVKRYRELEGEKWGLK